MSDFGPLLCHAARMQLLILGSVALRTEPCALLCARISGLSNFVGAMPACQGIPFTTDGVA